MACGERRETGGVVWVVLLFFILRTCTGFFSTGYGHMLPDDPFVFVGDNLSLNCTVTRDGLDWRDLYITRSGRDIDSRYLRKMNETTVGLIYPIEEPITADLFVCWLRDERNTMVDRQYVTADYPPAEVQNVSCVVLDRKNLNCTWKLPYEYRHPDNLSVHVTLSSSKTTAECCGPVKVTDTSADWASGRGSKFVFGHWYWLEVKVTYDKQGEPFSNSSVHVVKTRNIVKPSPVLERREYNSTPSSIVVRMYHKDDSYGKVALVQYASKWDPGKWLKTETGWAKRNPLEVNISGLTPFTIYTVRVAVRPKELGFPSDWRNFTVRTQPSAPDVAPELCPGCYSVESCDTNQNCYVRVYWKSIPRPFRNSEIKGYRLEMTPLPWDRTADPGDSPSRTADLLSGPGDLQTDPGVGTSTSTSTSADLQTPRSPDSGFVAGDTRTSRPCDGRGSGPGELAAPAEDWLTGPGSSTPRPRDSTPGGESQCVRPRVEGAGLVEETSQRVVVPGDRGSVVRLFALTSGHLWSRTCSVQYIPAVLGDKPAGPGNLVVEIDGQRASGWKGQFFLRWSDPGPKTASFVVVWCASNQNTRICLEGQDIQWQTVKANHTVVSVNISSDNGATSGPENFIIGVARHERCHHDQGDVSSGIVWSSCVYTRDIAPRVTPEIVSLTPTHSEGELHLSWTFTDCTSDVRTNVYVTHFVIHYCVNASFPNCDGTERTLTVGREKREVSLTGLEAGKVYGVRMGAMAEQRSGPFTHTVLRSVQGKAARSSDNFPFTFTVIGIFIVSVLLCVASRQVYTYCRKTAGKFAKTIETNGFPHPPSADGKMEQGGEATGIHVPAKQMSVNSETPLLGRDDVTEEEEEDVLPRHDVNSPCPPEGRVMMTRALVSKKDSKDASTQGSDSGVQLRHSGSDVGEAVAEDSPEDFGGVDVDKGPTSQSWEPAVNAVGSQIRSGYVSEALVPDGLSLVPSQLGRGRAGMTSAYILHGEGCPRSPRNTGLGVEDGVEEEAARTAPPSPSFGTASPSPCTLLGVVKDSSVSDEPNLTDGVEEQAHDIASEPVWVTRTAADISGNAYVRPVPDASFQLSECPELDAPDSESSTADKAILTPRSVSPDFDDGVCCDEDDDDDGYDDSDDGCLRIPEDILQPLLNRETPLGFDCPRLMQACLHVKGASDSLSVTDTSSGDFSKDSGGSVHVTPQPALPGPPDTSSQPPSSCLVGEDAVDTPCIISSTESLAVQDQTSHAANDPAVQSSSVGPQQPPDAHVCSVGVTERGAMDGYVSNAKDPRTAQAN